MSESAVEIEGLTVHYGKRAVLDALDWRVPGGAIVALVGENGAGKSTLLDAVIGLVPADRGRVRTLGLDPKKDGDLLRARIGYVESEPVFDLDDRVKETLAFHRGVRPRWNDVVAAECVKRLRLPTDRRVRALSRGERAKLALVIALATEPEMLVLDEPFDGLDIAVRDEVERAMIDHVASTGRTILLASHDIGEIERLADRVAVLRSGKIAVDLSADEVRRSVVRFAVPAAALERLDLAGADVLRRSGDDRALIVCGARSALAEELISSPAVEALPLVELRDAVRHFATTATEVSS